MLRPDGYRLPSSTVYNRGVPERQVTMPRKPTLRDRTDVAPVYDGAKPASWTEEGLCWDRQTHLPKPGFDRENLKPGEAARMCFGCPVMETCLAEAMAGENSLTARNRYLIRGGLSNVERAQLDRRERYAKQKLASLAS